MSKESRNLRALATDPLAPFKHERVSVPEWENAQLVVRELTAGDWVDYRSAIARAREAAGIEPGEPVTVPVNTIQATALVVARTLFYPNGRRVLTDADAVDVGAAFSAVHGRLADKAFELSGIVLSAPGEDGKQEAVDPVAEAGNA
jgi:hypothetical protein